MSIFQDVFVRKPGRSLFNLSHERKFSANFGTLYPTLVIDAVPGDTFKLGAQVIVRTAPMFAPLLHRVNVKLNYFFVPNRLLWQDWESFITGVDQDSYPDSPNNNYFVNPVKPYVSISTITDDENDSLFYDGSLADFLGFPTIQPKVDGRPNGLDGNSTINIDLLPFYAYNRIYVDWFRNENLEGGYSKPHGSGDHALDYEPYMHLKQRNWEKDYFTSCLPFAQRGDPVTIPVANGTIKFDKSGTTKVVEYGKTIPISNDESNNQSVQSSNDFDENNNVTWQYDNSGTMKQVNIDNSSNLKTEITIGTINDLRLATRIQRWLEKNARVGGRYIEQLLAHFGVHSSDARLQRVEYLGGFTLPIVVSDVEQNSVNNGGDLVGDLTPLGTLAGKGTAFGQSKPIKCYCEEFGFIFCIFSIIPRSAYQDGFPRMYKRSTRYDYYFPEFANLGEQEVTKDELYCDLHDATKQSMARFGFQERYVEYKYIPSTVHGEFKRNLDFFHLGRKFTSQPALNSSFAQVKNTIITSIIFNLCKT